MLLYQTEFINGVVLIFQIVSKYKIEIKVFELNNSSNNTNNIITINNNDIYSACIT